MENTYRDMIKKLVNEYYEQHISMHEYRIKRHQLIDQMDDEFNGAKFPIYTHDMNIIPPSK